MKKQIVLTALLGLVFIIGLFVAWEFTADDSFITFRYSRNLADGAGLTWNPDSPDPVEGFTSFSWMLLMVVPHLTGNSPQTFAKVIGLLLLLATVGVLYVSGKRFGLSVRAGVLAAASLLLLPSSYFHALSGMETMLYACLLLVLFVVGLEAFTSGSGLSTRWIYWLPVLVLLVGMTRPEGLLPGVVVLAGAFFVASHAQRRRIFFSTLVLLFLPGAVYFVWRYTYFGWMFPNTFYVKFGDPLNGIRWLAESAGSITVIMLAAAFFLITRPAGSRLRLTLFVVLFLAAAVAPYSYSHLMMNYMNRFMFHVMPVLVLLMAIGIESITRLLRGAHRTSAAAETVFCIVIAVFGLWPAVSRDKAQVAHLGLYESHLRNAHIRLADALVAADVPPELRTLTVGDAGAIPYFTDWHCYDYVGLNDETIAHQPSRRSAHIAEARPSVMILYSQDGRTPTPHQFGFEPDVMLDQYDAAAYIEWFPDYYLGVFLRSDLPGPVHTRLSQLINKVAEEARVDNDTPPTRSALLAHLRQRFLGK